MDFGPAWRKQGHEFLSKQNALQGFFKLLPRGRVVGGVAAQVTGVLPGSKAAGRTIGITRNGACAAYADIS